MDSKLVFTCIFLFFLSWGLQGFSQENRQMDLTKSVDSLEQGLAGVLQQVHQPSGAAAATTAASQGGASADAMPCMQKLMPCQPFMHSPSPPATCCSPLKDMITQEKQCLCKVFDNTELLKSVNLTKDEALALPKACGIDVDVSVCNNATSPGSSTNNTSSDSSNSSSSSSSSSSSNNSNAGIRISDTAADGGFWYIVSIVALFAN
ncbi:lipid transfer-like protein VAS [Durio zibethinus]|uniref:Lipid transfer-like protein VAS n=1 Tax=Durio zibethinus TaxID=66656 RepID=A0A6P5WHB2_DURZI|nr:lipid transfer-like protein VAS [Durio zibethinus]